MMELNCDIMQADYVHSLSSKLDPGIFSLSPVYNPSQKCSAPTTIQPFYYSSYSYYHLQSVRMLKFDHNLAKD